MAELEDIDDLTKKQKKLLEKYYYESTVASFKTSVIQSDVKFNAKASQLKSSSLLASIYLEYQKDNYLLKLKQRSSNYFHFLLEYSPHTFINKLKTRLEYKVSSQGLRVKSGPRVSIFYYREFARFQASLKDSPLLINFSLTTGKPEFGVGADWKFALNSQKYTKLVFALWWHKKHTNMVFKHIESESSLGKFEFSYFLKLSPIMHMASLITTNWSDKSTSIQIGADYLFDEDTLVKGKVDSCGKIGISLRRRLSERLYITLGSSVDTKESNSNKTNDYNFGFTLNYTQ